MTTSPSSLIIHTDGGARGNPGPAATGVVVRSENKTIHSFGRFLGDTTNNVAEYTAVIDALNWVINTYKQSYPSLSFRLDSNLVVEQVNRRWKIKEPHLFELANQVWSMINTHQLNTTFTYIPRAENELADREVNQVLDATVGPRLHS
jgi:probable phosphoglycerate mutase